MKTAFKKIIPWAILVLLIGGLVIWYFVSNRVTSEENASYNTKIAEAKKWHEGKEYSTAMITYYEAVEQIPSRIEAFEGILQILIEKGKIDDALSILDNSAQKLTIYDQGTLYALLCEEYMALNENGKALETCKKGQGLGEANQNLELALGKAYLKKNDIGNASELFKKNLFDGDSLSEAKLLLSYILATYDVENAKSTLGSVSPSEKWSVYYEEFSSVLGSLDSDTKYNATKLSRVYINSGYPTLAISVLEPIKDEIAEYLEGEYFLGRAYYEVGEYDKALEELNKAVTLGGMEEDIFWVEARAYIKKSDLSSALECYEKALGYMGSTPNQDFLSEYLDLLLENNQTLEADEVLQIVLAKTKEIYLYEYGIRINYVLQKTEKINYYIAELGKLALDDSTKKSYLYYKVLAMLDQNADLGETETVLDELLALDRFNPKYYYLLGRIEFEQGNSDASTEALKKSIEYDLEYSITEDATRLLSNIK